MHHEPQTRLAGFDPFGLIAWATGLCLMVPFAVTGPLGASQFELLCLMVGVLVLTVGLIWSLVALIVAAFDRRDDRRYVRARLWVNAVPWAATALLVYAGWLESLS